MRFVERGLYRLQLLAICISFIDRFQIFKGRRCLQAAQALIDTHSGNQARSSSLVHRDCTMIGFTASRAATQILSAQRRSALPSPWRSSWPSGRVLACQSRGWTMGAERPIASSCASHVVSTRSEKSSSVVLIPGLCCPCGYVD